MPGMADPDEIDVIAEDPDGNALLSIIQTGRWSRNGSELKALRRKLENYMRFALDGELVRRYPSLEGRAVVIELTYEFPLSGPVRSYWAKAGGTALKRGVKLSTRRLNDTVWRA